MRQVCNVCGAELVNGAYCTNCHVTNRESTVRRLAGFAAIVLITLRFLIGQ